MIHNRIKQEVSLLIIQHGLKPKHSTTTLYMELTQHILGDFNQ